MLLYADIKFELLLKNRH